MKTSGKYRILTLMAGIATALLIVFSQLFYFQAATYCQKEVQTQHQKEKEVPVKKTDTDAGQETYISIPSNTISSVSNIQLSEGLTVVLETLLVSEEEQTETQTPTLTNRLLHTLFRFIIASNAP